MKKNILMLTLIFLFTGVVASDGAGSRFSNDPTAKDYKPEFIVQNLSGRSWGVKVVPYSNKFLFPPSFPSQAADVDHQHDLIFDVPKKADGVIVELYVDGGEKKRTVFFQDYGFLKVRDGDRKGQRYNYGAILIKKMAESGEFAVVSVPFVDDGATWKTLREKSVWEF